MKNMIHRFSILVNCNLSDESLVTDRQQDFEQLYKDNGFIILPDNYTEYGKACRLVINCHGAGGTVTTDDSQVEHQALTQYLVAFNLATPKELFSYGAKRNNLALQLVAKFSKNKFASKPYASQLRNVEHCRKKKPPLCKGRWVCEENSEGL